mmetsp:Transcript_66677/g.156318  ORF Transcript_66677/g.156318 Transcript_66677/m.156318 type:complete len:84 (+) Transcript_66677:196-447(+)
MTLLCVKLGRYEARNFRSPKGVHGSQCNLPDLEALGIFEIDCYNATITDAMFTPSWQTYQPAMPEEKRKAETWPTCVSSAPAR